MRTVLVRCQKRVSSGPSMSPCTVDLRQIVLTCIMPTDLPQWYTVLNLARTHALC